MDPHGSTPAAGHGNPLKTYFAVFGFLTVVTVVEMLPLFGLLDLPALLLLVLSAVKFVTVALFFMHLLGDKPINTRVFFIPLLMAGASVAILMWLFDTWTLAWQENERGRDPDAVAERYRGRYEGECFSWVRSPITGNVYCASPAIGFTTEAAYAALKQDSAPDPLFEGFDAKSPDEKKAVLMQVGERVYGQNCLACHGPQGAGTPGVFPPLVGDPVTVAADATEHIRIVLQGMTGVPIAGVSYAAAMPPWAQLSDQEIAAVVTFERNSWGNEAGIVEPGQVAALR